MAVKCGLPRLVAVAGFVYYPMRYEALFYGGVVTARLYFVVVFDYYRVALVVRGGSSGKHGQLMAWLNA